MDEATRIEVLKNCSLFSGLNESEITWLARHLKPQQLQEGDVLFNKGDSSKGAYLVVSGQLGARRPAKAADTDASAGPANIFAEFAAGEIIGEFALIDSQPRSAEVVALSTTTVLLLEQAALTQLAEIHPLIGYHIMHNLARIIIQRLRNTNEQLIAGLQWNWKAGR
jgi:CRP-like cAMP-binding protein